MFQNRRWDGDMLTVRRLIADGVLGTVHRFQKLDLRASFGYRNPEDQRRRARVATLRSARRLHHTGAHRHRLWVTGPYHDPG